MKIYWEMMGKVGSNMSSEEYTEGLGVPKSRLTDFMSDLRGRLALLTELVPYRDLGLTIEAVRKPILVVGKPGIGKTSVVMSVIKELNAQLPREKHIGYKKILLGQTVVGSLSGIPVVKSDGNVVRVQMPDLPDESRDGRYGVLFLDEITTADEMQVQPALGLADDSRSLGEYSLPEGWIVVGAGNGPDCTNFIRLDDMTLTRFTCYDISYDYEKDWRPYAHKVGVSEDIIAFLNFAPDTCVRVESKDLDSAGKMFPCPRTWERLSVELKMREVLGNPVGMESLANFAGRIVGVKAGREFASFMLFKQKLDYSAEKILQGVEQKPKDMMKESFHIILQSCIKCATNLLEQTGDGSGNYPLTTYKQVGNMIDWFLDMPDLDGKVNAFVEIRNDIPMLAEIIQDEDFQDICPRLQEFFCDNAEVLLEVL